MDSNPNVGVPDTGGPPLAATDSGTTGLCAKAWKAWQLDAKLSKRAKAQGNTAAIRYLNQTGGHLIQILMENGCPQLTPYEG